MNKVLVIDNYDSFTYNLVHIIKEMNYDVTVVRNDKFDLDKVKVVGPMCLIEKSNVTYGITLGARPISEVVVRSRLEYVYFNSIETEDLSLPRVK